MVSIEQRSIFTVETGTTNAHLFYNSGEARRKTHVQAQNDRPRLIQHKDTYENTGIALNGAPVASVMNWS